jgi:tol-pal system protein YbgF
MPPPPDNPAFAALRPPGAAPPPQEPAAPPVAGSLPSGSASEQYNFAFGLLKQADYPAAEGALREFVREHPGDALAGNAQYWLGETYFARGKYADAATAFAEGYKRYPKGPKAADDLLKLGMSLARANQRQNACLAFTQLDHDFPNPGSAIKDRATAERKRVGC